MKRKIENLGRKDLIKKMPKTEETIKDIEIDIELDVDLTIKREKNLYKSNLYRYIK